MKIRRLIGSILALAMLLAAAGCGTKAEKREEILDKLDMEELILQELPEGTAMLELVNLGSGEDGYYMDCLAYDAEANLLSEETLRLPLADDISISFYPMEKPGSSGEYYGCAEQLYDAYDEQQMQGVRFWTFAFDEAGALCELSDELPRELIVEEHPVEDFYGCWDYSESFWQPGLEMYNVPGRPPCGDYIVLHEDRTAEIYRLEENTVYLADWEMWDVSAYIEALDIVLSFTDCGLEDSNGHYGDPGTPPPADGMERVDLTQP